MLKHNNAHGVGIECVKYLVMRNSRSQRAWPVACPSQSKPVQAGPSLSRTLERPTAHLFPHVFAEVPPSAAIRIPNALGFSALAGIASLAASSPHYPIPLIPPKAGDTNDSPTSYLQ